MTGNEIVYVFIFMYIIEQTYMRTKKKKLSALFKKKLLSRGKFKWTCF